MNQQQVDNHNDSSVAENNLKKLTVFSNLNFILASSLIQSLDMDFMIEHINLKTKGFFNILSIIGFNLKWICLCFNVAIYFKYDQKFRETLRKIFKQFLIKILIFFIFFPLFVILLSIYFYFLSFK